MTALLIFISMLIWIQNSLSSLVLALPAGAEMCEPTHQERSKCTYESILSDYEYKLEDTDGNGTWDKCTITAHCSAWGPYEPACKVGHRGAGAPNPCPDCDKSKDYSLIYYNKSPNPPNDWCLTTLENICQIFIDHSCPTPLVDITCCDDEADNFGL